MLDLLTSGLSVVFAPKMFILIIFAVFLGTLFGALPGVSAPWLSPSASPSPIRWTLSAPSHSLLQFTAHPSPAAA